MAFAPLIAAASICLSQPLTQPPQPVQPGPAAAPAIRIDRVGLFKNGVATVSASVELPGAGTYVLDQVPEPLHGTFWVESPMDVVVRMVERNLPDANAGPAHHPMALNGARVTVRLTEQHLPAVTGRVVGQEVSQQQWRTDYSTASNPYGSWYTARPLNTAAPMVGYLRVETDSGAVLIESSQIAMVEVLEPGEPPMVRRSVLEVTVPDDRDEPAAIALTWLTNGLTWAPSYAIDTADDSRLTLRQKAVIRNEWRDLTDVEIELITGFPGIEFGHVRSLMTPGTTMYDFFRELGQRNRYSNPSRADVMSQLVISNAAMAGGDAAAPAELTSSDGADLHYHSIGRFSIARGESAMIDTASGETSFDPVIYWRIAADDRADQARTPSFDNPLRGEQSGVWDALRFDNPLDIPMTTAPALVRRNGRILGQQMTWWTAPGDELHVPVTRALSIRTDHELGESAREPVRLGGWSGSRFTYEGVLTVTNLRDRPTEIIVSRAIRGTLESSDTPSEMEVINDAAAAPWVNPTQEIRWTVTLQPGEQRTIGYTFFVLRP